MTSPLDMRGLIRLIEVLVGIAEVRIGESRSALIQTGDIDPAELDFRESMQNNAAAVRNLFPPGEGYFPIVTMTYAGKHTVVDGHNRAAVAAERGDAIPYVAVPHTIYEALYAGEDDAAQGIRQKFPGARVLERGEQALIALENLIG